MHLQRFVVSLFLLLSLSLSLLGSAQEATPVNVDFVRAKPEQIGLSFARLEELSQTLQGYVDDGKVGGVVAAIARHGRLGYMEAFGTSESGDDLGADALFRVASMTKAITSAGIMSLVEDGEISLADPVSKFLPDFANPRVLKSIVGSDIATVPAHREPTIHDLLTHRSGLTYGWFGPDKLDEVYRKAGISNFFVPSDEVLEARVDRIAKLPLKFHPGESWDYSVSTDLLGRVIEVASELPLDRFLYERFFRPLKMKDTHFAVPASKKKRLADLYTIDGDGKLQVVTETPVQAAFLEFSSDYCNEQNGFFSGGGGLVSTTTDYLRFLQMLLNGGELDGQSVLSQATVSLMTQQQIGEMQIPFPGHGDGFGFGFGVLTNRGLVKDASSVGSYSWGGIFNTYYWVDPQEQLVCVLMTQLFPYDHLNLRTEFKDLVYECLDDSGFERVYRYKPGEEFANPHFNGRQLRVNAAEASIHPSFSKRSEPRSSGLARIAIDEDLTDVRRVDLSTEIWGGHPGTSRKRVSINGRKAFSIPEVGCAGHNCTHQYPEFNLPPETLVRGYNSLQFACDQGDTFWGHYIVDQTALSIGLNRNDEQLVANRLSDFEANVQATKTSKGYRLKLDFDESYASRISRVHFQGRYLGYDENGNGWRNDWHGMTKNAQRYGWIATTDESSHEAVWDTTMLPKQSGVQIRAVVEFQADTEGEKSDATLCFRTQVLKGLEISKPEGLDIKLFHAFDLPTPFWSRAGKKKSCTIDVPFETGRILEAELNVIAWTGGAGDVEDYFTLNGHHIPVAEGSQHETVYSKVSIDPTWLKQGENTIELHSDTEHHGIEILLPGPALAVLYQTDERKSQLNSKSGIPTVKLRKSARDASAGNIECYKIETPTATYYLDKVGAGLSSMVDRDGVDWLGFHPKKGSGAGGEYRGFPNAVYKEAGSYFHARNAGTDPCVTVVEEETDSRVVISATSDNGLWMGRYTFTEENCQFTMLKKPEGHNYWVLYEGVPGGTYDASDWWMGASLAKKNPMTLKQDADLVESEWIAFGDKKSPRMLLLTSDKDDEHPDRFYQMQEKMTVFGFGRAGMKKYLSSTPQTFSIGFVEGTNFQRAQKTANDWIDSTLKAQISTSAPDSKNQGLPSDPLAKRDALQTFALREKGDPDAGKKLFFEDVRTKCATCHKVGKEGGVVGPDLTKIGGKFDRPHLIESILEPSAQIVEGFRTTVLVTEDGAIYSGIAKSVDEEAISLVLSDGKRKKVLVNEVEMQREASVSLMPTGVADLLTKKEFADLVAYLETLRSGPSKFGAGTSGPIELPDGFEISTVATGLSGATALDIANDGKIFVCEQDGHLRVIENGKLLSEPVLSLDVEHNWERGLIGVAVAPNFLSDPHIYVVYVSDKPYTHHRVSRFRVEGNRADPASEKILLMGDDQSKFGGNVPAGHQGGAIHFGIDGKLYIGIGEQTAKTPSQRFDALQGKILCINPDGSIPKNNPFVDRTEGKYQSIWALGCRNPFTFAINTADGEMLINDVGGKYEEINRGVAGANYGWPGVDHGPTNKDGITGPIHIYPQASISGGDFVPESSNWPKEFLGRYLFADFVHGWIKSIDPENAEQATTFASGLRRPVDMRFGADGSLYVLLRNAWVVDGKFEGGTGSLMRIEKK